MKDYIIAKINDSEPLAETYTAFGKMLNRYIYYKLKKLTSNFISDFSEDRLVILYGLRGVGKTTLLFQIYNQLRKEHNIEKANIVYISVEELVGYTGKTLADAVLSFVSEIHGSTIATLNKKIFLLIDEVHFDKNWEKAVKPLWDQSKNIFVIVTGSSAIALTLSTDTSRRAIKEPLFPLNFAEYEMLKNHIFPERNITEDIKKVVLMGDAASLISLQEKEKKYSMNYSSKSMNIDEEVETFLAQGGFCNTLQDSTINTHKRVMDILERIVRSDLPQVQSFNTDTLNDVFRILGHLAIKRPGETSHGNIANDLGISPTKVKQIFDALEKTHLLFSVKPYMKSAGAYARSPWKYYFMSPTIITALRSNAGLPTKDDYSKGAIYETAVAVSLFRLSETSMQPITINYDKGEDSNSNVDFLLVKQLTGEIIPVEIGLNKKSKQVIDAMARYGSPYGVIITNVESTKFEGNIFKIPIRTFLLI